MAKYSPQWKIRNMEKASPVAPKKAPSTKNINFGKVYSNLKKTQTLANKIKRK